MDILYQLPSPKDICNKIFIFACKSPHNDLGGAILKNIIGLHMYNVFSLWIVIVLHKMHLKKKL